MTKPDQPHPNVVFTPLDENSGALLHLDNKRYFTLNETGVILWRRLEAGDDRSAMARALEDEFDVTSEEARQAVDEFFDELRRERLLASSRP
jgi:hypothetical protein